MNSKNIKNKFSRKQFSKPLMDVDICDVSKASAAIMLDRFCNGKEIDFPFLNN